MLYWLCLRKVALSLLPGVSPAQLLKLRHLFSHALASAIFKAHWRHIRILQIRGRLLHTLYLSSTPSAINLSISLVLINGSNRIIQSTLIQISTDLHFLMVLLLLHEFWVFDIIVFFLFGSAVFLHYFSEFVITGCRYYHVLGESSSLIPTLSSPF